MDPSSSLLVYCTWEEAFRIEGRVCMLPKSSAEGTDNAIWKRPVSHMLFEAYWATDGPSVTRLQAKQICWVVLCVGRITCQY